MPNKKGWRVVRPNGQKSSPFANEDAAIVKTKRELAGTESKVFVFDKAGRLVDTLSPQK